MSHAVSDATMQPLQVCHCRIKFRLGVQFSFPGHILESLLPARYVRMQIAAPPPDRIDRSDWLNGLRISAGNGGVDREFAPDDPNWREPGVYPVEGISPLGLPLPEVLVLDQWVTASRQRESFTLTGDGPAEVPHFVSVAYPPPGLGGGALTDVDVDYYKTAEARFTREAKGGWIAVSLDRFWPPERSSADYIIPVADCPPGDADHQAALEQLRSAAAGEPIPATPAI